MQNNSNDRLIFLGSTLFQRLNRARKRRGPKKFVSGKAMEYKIHQGAAENDDKKVARKRRKKRFDVNKEEKYKIRIEKI